VSARKYKTTGSESATGVSVGAGSEVKVDRGTGIGLEVGGAVWLGIGDWYGVDETIDDGDGSIVPGTVWLGRSVLGGAAEAVAEKVGASVHITAVVGVPPSPRHPNSETTTSSTQTRNSLTRLSCTRYPPLFLDDTVPAQNSTGTRYRSGQTDRVLALA
jgi:hypothetical protein